MVHFQLSCVSVLAGVGLDAVAHQLLYGKVRVSSLLRGSIRSFYSYVEQCCQWIVSGVADIGLFDRLAVTKHSI